MRHLLMDVLSKKTLDKVLRLLRKLDWNSPEVSMVLTLACKRGQYLIGIGSPPDAQVFHQTLEDQAQPHQLCRDARI